MNILHRGIYRLRSAVSFGLAKLEGGAAALLPFANHGKKPTGGPGDPLHVIVAAMPGVPSGLSSLGANALGGNPSVNLSNLISGLYPSGTSDSATGGSTSGIGSSVGSALGAALNVASIAGFADGTPPLSEGTMAWVGERGPELAYLGKGTGIIPNDTSRAMTGGFHHHGDVNVHIPPGTPNHGEIRAAVHQGYTAAVRDSQAASAHGQSERTRRTPGLARR